MPTKAAWLAGRRRWAFVTLAFVALYAAFGFLVVPWIVQSQIRKQARAYLNREATVERVRFNPFTLVTRIEGLRLADRDGADLMSFDRLRVDLQVSGLLRRAWRFGEIVVEGPVVTFRILADGRPSVADLLEADEAPAAKEPFRPPRLIIDRFAVSAGRVEFSDRSRQPAFESRFEPVNLEVRDLITIPEESGEHAITVGVGDGAELRWTGTQTVEPLHFTGRFDITGIDLAWLWTYLGHGQPLAIADGHADLVLPYDLRHEPQKDLALSLDDASFTVRGLVVRPREGTEDWLSVPELQVREVDAAWPAARVEVGGIRVAEPHALLRVDENAALNWLAIQAPAPVPSESPIPPAAADAPRWDVRVGSVEIERGSVHFDDRTTEPDVVIDLAEIGLRLEGLSSDLGAQVAFQAQARVEETGTLEAKGVVVPQPMVAKADLSVGTLALSAIRPYVTLLPGAQLTSGVVALHGSAEVAGEPQTISFTGSARLDDLELLDARGERLVAHDQLRIEGLRLKHPPTSVRIETVVLERAFAKIRIDREGQLNLMSYTAQAAPGEPGQPPVAVEIGTVNLRDATIDFTDESLILPFGTEIHSANGTIRDLSTFSAAPATVAVEGRVDQTGSVQIDGVVRVADPYASTDLNVGFRGIEMPNLTPYSAEFAGYAIERGLLDLSVRYHIENRRLVGDHRIVAKDLVLGNKVEGASGAGLAVRLAIALLKDKDGKIDLDVSIEGTVDSPEFAYRKVFWQAFRKILANVAMAPFRALGRLFGRDEEDLELIEFDPGRSDLLPGEQDKLAKLAAELGPRAELTIEVEGRFDPVSDPQAIRRAKLESAIEARRAEAATTAAASGASTLETILEALFAERFSAEALTAERLRFAPVPPEAALSAASTASPKAKGKKKVAEPPPPPPAAPAEFDAAGFYEALRAKLLDAETVTDAELAALGTARADTIRSALGASGTLDAGRVKALDPTPVKRKKAGSDRIASEMMLSAGEKGEAE